MGAIWQFLKVGGSGQSVSEPLQGQFFHQDFFGDSVVKAFVREGIQNALDAQANPQEPVRVRIALVRGDNRKDANRIFTPDVWEHINARRNGLPPDELPAVDEKCNYLVFEDFGTIGLTGNIKQLVPRDGEPNNFFNFFRATGATDKVDKTLGKWGVGKYTFWMVSRIKTVFGFSIRESDQPKYALMGKTVLKSHAIGDSRDMEYQEGFYGNKDGDSGAIVPLSESDRELSLFRGAFKMQRGTEPGLSIVVPWIPKAIAKVSRDELVASVLADYFYPIIAGRLVVSVVVKGKEAHINADNIGELAADDRVAHLIRLAQLTNSGQQPHEIRPISFSQPDWSEDMFAPDMLKQLSESLRNNEDVLLRVGVEVPHKEGLGMPAHFNIALVQTDESDDISVAPYFVRDGIIIPKVRHPVLNNLVALVVAEGDDLAQFLGDSENPSHTHWQQSLLLEKRKYKIADAKALFSFVCSSVYKINQIVTGADKEQDRAILADIFPRPGTRQKPKSPRQKSEKPKPLPTPQPPQCIIRQTDSGFSLGCNPGRVIAAGATLTVRAAYHIRRGNPLNRYAEGDFLMQNLPRESTGMEEILVWGNELRAEITSPDFSLRVSGFDKNRDIYVDARITEAQEGRS